MTAILQIESGSSLLPALDLKKLYLIIYAKYYGMLIKYIAPRYAIDKEAECRRLLTIYLTILAIHHSTY